MLLEDVYSALFVIGIPLTIFYIIKMAIFPMAISFATMFFSLSLYWRVRKLKS